MIVHDFLGWFHTAPVAARADAASALARAYLYADMANDEREAAEAAMTLLLDDPAPTVRAALAEALASSPVAPRHIMLALAGDQPDVAEAILERSPVLLDAELVDLAADGGDRVQCAIARRHDLSSSVAAAIAEIGSPAACVIVIDNPTAVIVAFSLQRIAERYGTDAAVRNALMERDDLPLQIRQLLLSKLGEALNALPVVRGWLDPERAKTIMREACDKATVSLAYDADDDELPAFVEHLRISGQLTPALLLRGVCVGDIRLLAAVLARLTGQPFMRVTSILAEGHEPAFAAIFKRSGLPASAYPAFEAAISVWRETILEADDGDRYRFARRMIERILTRYGDFADGEFDRLMILLRRFAADAARDAARDYAAPFVKAA